jgi:hypothetical protein
MAKRKAPCEIATDRALIYCDLEFALRDGRLRDANEARRRLRKLGVVVRHVDRRGDRRPTKDCP